MREGLDFHYESLCEMTNRRPSRNAAAFPSALTSIRLLWSPADEGRMSKLSDLD